MNTFTRPLNLQLPIRQRPNSRQKRGSPLPFAPSIEKMGRYFPRHSSRTPFNVPNVGRLPAETTTVERIYIYILTILSFRRSVAAVCEAGILRSFLLLSLFFGGTPPLQCSTTARAVGPILRLVPGTTGKSYYKLDESREVAISISWRCSTHCRTNRYRCCIYLSVFQCDSSVGNGRRRF